MKPSQPIQTVELVRPQLASLESFRLACKSGKLLHFFLITALNLLIFNLASPLYFLFLGVFFLSQVCLRNAFYLSLVQFPEELEYIRLG